MSGIAMMAAGTVMAIAGIVLMILQLRRIKQNDVVDNGSGSDGIAPVLVANGNGSNKKKGKTDSTKATEKIYADEQPTELMPKENEETAMFTEKLQEEDSVEIPAEETNKTVRLIEE